VNFNSGINQLNNKFATYVTIGFGTMWCLYVFLVFSLLPIFAPQLEHVALYISNCVQLVALPALMVGNAILAKGAAEQAEQDHNVLKELLDDMREELVILKKLT